MFSIVISEKGGSERRESFKQREVTVGRVQSNDLTLAKGNVSKRHCRLESIEGRFVVTDQNSTNGTYVNRRRITQSTVVRQGDRIYIGDFILRIDDGTEEHASVEPDAESLEDADAVSSNDVRSTDDLARVSVELAPPAGDVSLPPPASPSRSSAPRPPMPTASGSLGSATGKNEHLSTGPAIAAGSQEDGAAPELVSAIRLLVERVGSKIEPRLLEREIDSALVQRVERLIDEAHAQHGGSEALATGNTAAILKAAARAELLELGPLGPLLDDPAVTEVAASAPGFLVVLRAGQREAGRLPFAAAQSVERAIARLCRQEGQPLAEDEFVVRRQLSGLGFDLDALRGAATPGGSVLRLKRRDPVVSNFEELVRAGVVSRSMATFLRHCVQAQANILIVGARRSGTAELLSAFCEAAAPDRVLALHAEEELASESGSVTPLAAGPLASADALLGAVAGFPGHRLLIDGMQGERARATLRAIADGAESTIACIRGGSIERACARVCAELAMTMGGQTSAAVADSLVVSFDIVVEVARLKDGRSRVLRIGELRRGTESVIEADSVFDFLVERTATGGSIEGSFNPSGRSPRVASEIRARGSRLDTALFLRPPRSG